MRLLGSAIGCFGGFAGKPECSSADGQKKIATADDCDYGRTASLQGLPRVHMGRSSISNHQRSPTDAAQYTGKAHLYPQDSAFEPRSFAISTGVLPGTPSSDASSWTSGDDSSPRTEALQSTSAIRSKVAPDGAALGKLQQFSNNSLSGPLTGTEPLPHAAAPAAASPTDHLYSYIQQYGRGILSLSTLQPGLQHFLVPGVGYIAYAMMYNGPPFLNIKTAVALGDPLCEPEDSKNLAAAFLEQHPRAMFMQISAAFAQVLQDLGMLVNSTGGETQLDLQKYTFSGYTKRGLRSAMSSAVKEGSTVQEVMQAPNTASTRAVNAAASVGESYIHDWSQLATEMREVDQAWVKAKGKQAGNMWFINRAPVFAPERGVRKLVARDAGGRLEAFIFYDSVYQGGQVVGYYANVTRMRPDAHPGVLNLLVKEFIDRVRAELHLATPQKKLSIKKSQRNKQQQQEQQELLLSDTTPQPDASPSTHTPTTTNGTTTTSDSHNSEAPRFLSLGLSPFHQMEDSSFKHSPHMRRVLEAAYKQATAFYPAKSLAAAKAKYGAGLHDGRYTDPNVTYNQVYLAHNRHTHGAALVALFDLGVMLGFWNQPVDAVTRYLTYQAKRRAKKLRKSRSLKL